MFLQHLAKLGRKAKSRIELLLYSFGSICSLLPTWVLPVYRDTLDSVDSALTAFWRQLDPCPKIKEIIDNTINNVEESIGAFPDNAYPDNALKRVHLYIIDNVSAFAFDFARRYSSE